MEMEIDALLSSGNQKGGRVSGQRSLLPNIDIDEMYSKLCELADDSGAISAAAKQQNAGGDSKESFWREMEHSDGDPFETICYFLSRGHLEDL